MKRSTFGKDLESVVQLARDHVTDAIAERIRKMASDYCEAALGAKSCDLFLYQSIINKPGLSPAWGDARRGFPIRKEDGTLSGLCATCFESKKPLWVVGANQETLTKTDNYSDLWSRTKELPPYLDNLDIEAKTLICFPVPRRGRSPIEGVVNIESELYLTPNSVAKEEVAALSRGLHSLYTKREDNSRIQAQIEDAINHLRHLSGERRNLNLFIAPKLFFASPSNADKEVIGVIRQVLGEFENSINVVFWDEINDTGHIDMQILKRIEESRFGLCYLSEMLGSSPIDGYKDNPNVIFEAGLLQAQQQEPISDLRNWIPIRENNSPPTPFDFMTHRIIYVPRLKDGKLNKAQFSAELQARLESIFESQGLP